MSDGIEKIRIELGNGVTMYRAADGGPVRFGVTGLKRNTTHVYPSSKVPNHILPAESDAELQVMMLLDMSISVLTYMAQPHSLEFPNLAGNRNWFYTPDIEAIVPRWFVRQLDTGIRFAPAALKLPQRRAEGDDLVRLVLEVKGASKYRQLTTSERSRDLDRITKRKAKDADYESKLLRVESIYREIGYHFHRVEEMIDLRCLDLTHIPSILMDDSAKVTHAATNAAWKHLKERGGLTTYATMIEVLGGGAFGREAANYLHIIGHIWIDFSSQPSAATKVAMPPLLGSRRDFFSLLSFEKAA